MEPTVESESNDVLYRNGSTTVKNGKRKKSASRVQISRIPFSRINTAVWTSCIRLPLASGNSVSVNDSKSKC